MADTPLDWIDQHYLRPDPFAFSEGEFGAIIRLISTSFDVDPNGIYCIGSGAIGLSLNPSKVERGQLKGFSPTSDIDLALVSDYHFFQAWRDLRVATQPTISEIDELVSKNITWQKKRLFDGATIASKLLPALTFAPRWLPGHEQLKMAVARELGGERDVNYWIYRDYWSLRNYISKSIELCRVGADLNATD